MISSGEEMNLSILISQIENSSFEWLLGTDIDRKMSFENHINQICTKGKTKIKALAKTIPFLNKGKIKLLNIHFSNLSLVIAHYHGCIVALN